jgi:hypothetical protein
MPECKETTVRLSRCRCSRAYDNRLKSGFCRGNIPLTMSLVELKNNVLALPETERHDFVVWLNHLEQNGNVPGECKQIGLARSMEADFFEQ